MQYCSISLDNNNSVKFVCSRKDNSTTNDGMVMKIAHAQHYMYTNIMYKFQSSMCKTVGEKRPTKLCPQTDGRTAMVIPVFQSSMCKTVGEKLRTKLCPQTDGRTDGRTERQTG